MSNVAEKIGFSPYFSEDDLIPISALQHYVFCNRQCALIHIERIWDENKLTAEGRLLHKRVHEAGSESRPDLRIARGLRLRSLKLGVAGLADVVEFIGDPCGVVVPGLAGRWKPRPIEYKRGRPKPDLSDKVQLCAQAVCLEEMLGVDISDGQIFYGQPRRRLLVPFTKDLRQETAQVALGTRSLIRSGETPAARPDRRCRSCSLSNHCLPGIAGVRKSARRYIGQMISS